MANDLKDDIVAEDVAVEEVVSEETADIVAEDAAVDEAEAEEIVEEIVVDASIQSMFEGMDLSEDFKAKVTLVFEAAVNETATAKADAIIAENVTRLESEMTESVDSAVNGIVENLDSYLDYVVEEWMKENELAIEAGIKVEMAESLMSGLKDMFEAHDIDISEEKADVVADLEEQVADIKDEANKAIMENVELSRELAAMRSAAVFDEMSEDLTLTQRERLKVLSEKLNFEDIGEYTNDLKTLKESFFAKKTTIVEEAEEEVEIMTEDTDVKTPVSDYSSINALVEALNAKTK
jgi:hypothetical protein